MNTRLDRVRRAVPAVLGGVTLGGVAVLLAWDLAPGRFPAGSHEFLAASPLALIAVAYLLYQAVRRTAPREWVKAAMLAAAFLCWSANQLWPGHRAAGLLNDIAIALFVFDVFLVIIGWPASSPDEAFAETSVDAGNLPAR